MDEYDLRQYLKDNLKIELQLDYEKDTLSILLYLKEEVISQSVEYLPFQKSEYDDYGNRIN